MAAAWQHCPHLGSIHGNSTTCRELGQWSGPTNRVDAIGRRPIASLPRLPRHGYEGKSIFSAIKHGTGASGQKLGTNAEAFAMSPAAWYTKLERTSIAHAPTQDPEHAPPDPTNRLILTNAMSLLCTSDIKRRGVPKPVQPCAVARPTIRSGTKRDKFLREVAEMCGPAERAAVLRLAQLPRGQQQAALASIAGPHAVVTGLPVLAAGWDSAPTTPGSV